MVHLVAPSILSADFANLGRDIEMVNKSKADWLHIDVMDGVFVPNISFGFPVLSAVKKIAKKPLDVHLMIIQPDKYLSRFRDCGADSITIHYEADIHLHRTLEAIKEMGMKAAVALNPHTSVQVLSEVISDIDMVCLMSVNPGFGGQQFIENTFQKITSLKTLMMEKASRALIEIDGGVGMANAQSLVKAGASVLVAGNAVFSSADPAKTIHDLKYF